MSTEFSLILITKGRKDISNCLNSIHRNMEKFRFKLIIIDGNKDDLLKKNIEHSSLDKFDIKIYKQKKGKFMRACFESIKYVDTKFFSFMYDDDVLSDHYYKIIHNSISNNVISIGKGIIQDIDKNTDFLKPGIKVEVSKNNLYNYYSFSLLKKRNLPNSPICSVFKATILDEWKNFLYKNCLKNKNYFDILLKKNIGPDLLIYLMSLQRENEIMTTDTIMAKFSHHEDSMSVKYGSESLIFGYLITKILFFKSIFKELDLIERIKIKIYLILQLFYILIRNLVKKNKLNFPIFKMSIIEIYSLMKL
jgi:hypothetical protein